MAGYRQDGHISPSSTPDGREASRVISLDRYRRESTGASIAVASEHDRAGGDRRRCPLGKPDHVSPPTGNRMAVAISRLDVDDAIDGPVSLGQGENAKMSRQHYRRRDSGHVPSPNIATVSETGSRLESGSASTNFADAQARSVDMLKMPLPSRPHGMTMPPTPRPPRLQTPELDEAPVGMFPELQDVVRWNKATAFARTW